MQMLRKFEDNRIQLKVVSDQTQVQKILQDEGFSKCQTSLLFPSRNGSLVDCAGISGRSPLFHNHHHYHEDLRIALPNNYQRDRVFDCIQSGDLSSIQQLARTLDLNRIELNGRNILIALLLTCPVEEKRCQIIQFFGECGIDFHYRDAKYKMDVLAWAIVLGQLREAKLILQNLNGNIDYRIDENDEQQSHQQNFGPTFDSHFKDNVHLYMNSTHRYSPILCLRNSLLHLSVMSGCLEVVQFVAQLMSQNGVNCNAQNSQGLTAYLLARRLGLKRISEYLETFGPLISTQIVDSFEFKTPRELSILGHKDRTMARKRRRILGYFDTKSIQKAIGCAIGSEDAVPTETMLVKQESSLTGRLVLPSINSPLKSQTHSLTLLENEESREKKISNSGISDCNTNTKKIAHLALEAYSIQTGPLYRKPNEPIEPKDLHISQKSRHHKNNSQHLNHSGQNQQSGGRYHKKSHPNLMKKISSSGTYLEIEKKKSRTLKK